MNIPTNKCQGVAGVRGIARAVVFLAVALGSALVACEAVTHSGDFATTVDASVNTVFLEGGTIVVVEEAGCPATELTCASDAGATCVDPTSDPQHCGGCNGLCGGTEICVSGVCACPVGETLCGAGCVDITSSAANCGACGHPCGADHLCSNGTCVASCQPGYVNCGDQCVAPTDVSHCGTCDNVCPANDNCIVEYLDAGVSEHLDSGVVVYGCCAGCECPAGTTLCPGFGCVDLSTDPNHCGACDTGCSSGQTCGDAKCACGVGETLCGTSCTTCPAGGSCSTDDDGTCVCPGSSVLKTNTTSSGEMYSACCGAKLVAEMASDGGIECCGNADGGVKCCPAGSVLCSGLCVPALLGCGVSSR